MEQCNPTIEVIDPLKYLKYLHEMRIVAIIKNQHVVEKILKYLDLLHQLAHTPPVNEETKIVEEAIYNFIF